MTCTWYVLYERFEIFILFVRPRRLYNIKLDVLFLDKYTASVNIRTKSQESFLIHTLCSNVFHMILKFAIGCDTIIPGDLFRCYDKKGDSFLNRRTFRLNTEGQRMRIWSSILSFFLFSFLENSVSCCRSKYILANKASRAAILAVTLTLSFLHTSSHRVLSSHLYGCLLKGLLLYFLCTQYGKGYFEIDKNEIRSPDTRWICNLFFTSNSHFQIFFEFKQFIPNIL